MAEFLIGEHLYRSSKLSAMDAWLVSKRFGPTIAKLAKLHLSGEVSARPPEDSDEMPPANGNHLMLAMLEPLGEAIASMSDEDSIFIIGKCMAHVERQRRGDTGWSKVWNVEAKHPQFADITMVQMLQITGHVLWDNLGDFGSVLS